MKRPWMLASVYADILMTIFSCVLKDGMKCYTNIRRQCSLKMKSEKNIYENKKERSSFNRIGRLIFIDTVLDPYIRIFFISIEYSI